MAKNVKPKTQKKQEKPGKGRPSKYTDDIVAKMEMLFRRGFTVVEVSKIIDISEDSILRWRRNKPDFCKTLGEWKADADIRVEKSLYERACGFEHPEEKVFCNNGEIITHLTTKKYPPDYQSMALWLKNRQPDKWRDKIEHEHGGSVSINIVKFSDVEGDGDGD
jgi:hypothetical protein